MNAWKHGTSIALVFAGMFGLAASPSPAADGDKLPGFDFDAFGTFGDRQVRRTAQGLLVEAHLHRPWQGRPR
jgi:hypothetical protein